MGAFERVAELELELELARERAAELDAERDALRLENTATMIARRAAAGRKLGAVPELRQELLTCPDCQAVQWGNAYCPTCRSHWPGGDPVTP